MTDNKKDDMFDTLTILKLFNRGVAKAIEENKRLNIPSVFCINKTILYLMPDGSIRREYDYSKHINKPGADADKA